MARMNNNTTQANQKDPSIPARTSSYSGRFLFGTVSDRTLRYVPKDHPTTEIVTYTVQSSHDTHYFVDHFAPDSYYNIGADVCFPVYIKTYKRRNGDPAYTLMLQQDETVRGECF